MLQAFTFRILQDSNLNAIAFKITTVIYKDKPAGHGEASARGGNEMGGSGEQVRKGSETRARMGCTLDAAREPLTYFSSVVLPKRASEERP